MKLGIHAYAWTNHWDNSQLPLFQRAASLGLDLLEVPLMAIDDVDPPAIRAAAAEAGIGVVASTVLDARTDITAEEPAVREAGVAYLKRCVDAVHGMGADLLSGVIYVEHGKRPHQRPDEALWDRSAQALRAVGEYAARHGIAIGLEPVNRYESCVLNTSAQAVAMIDRIGLPNVMVHLDTYHMNIEEKDWSTPVHTAGARLCHIHLCENDRGIPGTGLVQWEALFGALRAIGYDGYGAMESFFSVSDDMRSGTCIWRDLAPDGDTLVSEGLRFLKSMAARHGPDKSTDVG
ncbi:MAG TPA: sugar phosphate isomerase/epimerase family protein [Chloroflexota bacterium]|jgi:D-psicose/D-tagatose/L-ribulose 3-epimerase|nr:sugar phosphate isomerase/epimerase family protein [Chloroflexota bacterium]